MVSSVRLRWFLFLSILVLCNVLTIHFFTDFEARIVRVFSVFLFILLFIINKRYKGPLIFSVLILLFLSDILVTFKEIFIHRAGMIINIIVYLVLLVHVLITQKTKKLNNLVMGLYAFLVILNTYTLTIMLRDETDHSKKILLFIYGTVMITTCLLAGSYTIKSNIKKSMYFKLCVFGFCFSDLCAFLAYNFDVHAMFYLDRTVYVFSLYFMTKYAMEPMCDKDNLLIDD